MELKMVLPKGRMNDKVKELLADAGIPVRGSDRSYRPKSDDPGLKLKLLKSQNIPPLVALGQHDCGFAGYDWVREQEADVVEVLDLGFDPVKIVACIPEKRRWEDVKKRPIIAVTEYCNLSRQFLSGQGVDFTILRSYGATEVFPPEDADMIVDNTATGATLVANRLQIIETLMASSTRFIANRAALEDPGKRQDIENLSVLFQSVLEGRERVLLEMNCSEAQLERLVKILPAMRSPTIAKLYRQNEFSVRAAVPKRDIKDLVPKLRQAGATDMLELEVRKVVP